MGGWGKREGVQGVDPHTNGKGLLNNPTSGTVGQQLGPWKAQNQKKSPFWKSAFILVVFDRLSLEIPTDHLWAVTDQLEKAQSMCCQ